MPLLPRARELVADGHVPGGTRRNSSDVAAWVDWDPALDDAVRTLLCDAQTSGGLLIAVAPERADQLIARLRAERTPAAVRIGTVVEGDAGRIAVMP